MSLNQFTPLKVLNPFILDWRIKVRVTRKSTIKEWKNERGEGKILTINLVDCEGTQMQANFYNEAAANYNKLIFVGRVILLTNG